MLYVYAVLAETFTHTICSMKGATDSPADNCCGSSHASMRSEPAIGAEAACCAVTRCDTAVTCRAWGPRSKVPRVHLISSGPLFPLLTVHVLASLAHGRQVWEGPRTTEGHEGEAAP